MTTYRLVRTGNTGNSNSYSAGGGITINGDTISTNPTEDLVISGDKIGIKPTYIQDNFYVTGTSLVREVADGTKVNLDFTDLINHIDEVFGYNTNVELPKGTINYNPETKELTYDPGLGDDFISYMYLPAYTITADGNLLGIEDMSGGQGNYIELGEGLSSDISGLSNPSYGGKLTNTGQVVKLTDGLGKSMVLPQGEYIISPEYKTGYYYVEGNDLPSNPIQDGMAYYVTKEYYGSLNFKLTATHVGTGRTFVGVNSDRDELVWKELTSGA